MDQQIVLGRVGHYFDAGNGSCSTALVVEGPSGGLDEKFFVNVAAWHHGGESFSRTSVLVAATPSTNDGQNSFHLTRDCPWAR